MNDDIKPINNDFQPPSSPPNLEPSTAPQPIAPFQPPAKKSRKKLWLIIIVVIVAIAAIGGGAAYALWYNNPEKVVTDAVGNVIKSPTSISSAVFESKTKEGDKLTVSFNTQADNPKLAGSLSAKVNVNSKDFAIDLEGAGMITESGDFYFKIDNAQELVTKLLATDYGKLYASNSALQKALKDFAKKIDGRWVKVDTKDIESAVDNQGYKTERQCYQKALQTFYSNKDQQTQVIDAYQSNKFVIVKNDSGSAKINGVDSKSYDILFNVQKSQNFSDAAEKTDVVKAAKKCDKNNSNFENSTKPTQEEIKDSQKEADKTKLKLWVSKWSHDLTGVDASYSGDDGMTSTFKVKTDFKTRPQLDNPKDALSFSDLQNDLNKIFSAVGISESTAAEFQSGQQAKARDTKQKTDAALAAREQQLQQ